MALVRLHGESKTAFYSSGAAHGGCTAGLAKSLLHMWGTHTKTKVKSMMSHSFRVQIRLDETQPILICRTRSRTIDTLYLCAY